MYTRYNGKASIHQPFKYTKYYQDTNSYDRLDMIDRSGQAQLNIKMVQRSNQLDLRPVTSLSSEFRRTRPESGGPRNGHTLALRTRSVRVAAPTASHGRGGQPGFGVPESGHGKEGGRRGGGGGTER